MSRDQTVRQDRLAASPALRRWSRRAAVGLALALVLPIAGALALWLQMRALGPPPLDAIRVVSTTVVDRRGELLRAFTTPGGRWRLPLTVADVQIFVERAPIAFESNRSRGRFAPTSTALRSR